LNVNNVENWGPALWPWFEFQGRVKVTGGVKMVGGVSEEAFMWKLASNPNRKGLESNETTSTDELQEPAVLTLSMPLTSGTYYLLCRAHIIYCASQGGMVFLEVSSYLALEFCGIRANKMGTKN